MKKKGEAMRPGGRFAPLQWGVLLLCAVGFLWFFHVVFWGVFNIGNIAGMLLCLLPAAAVLFRHRLCRLLRGSLRRVSGRIVCCALAAVLLAGLSVAAVFGARIIKAAGNAPPEPAQEQSVLVVLGALVKPGGVPSRSLQSRIDAAAAYLQAHPDSICVLSGGRGEDEDMAEAACMLQELTNRGFAPERFLVEDRSTSTEENIAFSAALLRSRGLGDTVILVTNEYHQYRAGLFAAREGLRAYALSARTPRSLLPTYFLREIFGGVYTKAFRRG